MIISYFHDLVLEYFPSHHVWGMHHLNVDNMRWLARLLSRSMLLINIEKLSSLNIYNIAYPITVTSSYSVPRMYLPDLGVDPRYTV